MVFSPRIVNHCGIAEVLELPLTPAECEALQRSARAISEAIMLLDAPKER